MTSSGPRGPSDPKTNKRGLETGKNMSAWDKNANRGTADVPAPVKAKPTPFLKTAQGRIAVIGTVAFAALLTYNHFFIDEPQTAIHQVSKTDKHPMVVKDTTSGKDRHPMVVKDKK